MLLRLRRLPILKHGLIQDRRIFTCLNCSILISTSLVWLVWDLYFHKQIRPTHTQIQKKTEGQCSSNQKQTVGITPVCLVQMVIWFARTGCCIKWLRLAAGGSTCFPLWHRGTKQIWRWRWKCQAATACPRIGCPSPASCWCDCRKGGHRASSGAGTQSWCTPAKGAKRGANTRQTYHLSQTHHV